MAEQAELAFVKNYVTNISSQPVTFADDYQQPLENTLKRVPVLPVDLPSPPERKTESSTTSASIKVTFKSLKPAKSYTVSVQPTDTIASIKAQLATEPGAPPADVQRLLLKGKALADGKLLKEYDVKNEDTINLMVKPGFTWNPSDIARTASPAPIPSDASLASLPVVEPEPIVLVPEPKQGKSRHGHSRIPSVVLSPSPSLTPAPDEKLTDIPLILDTSLSLSALAGASDPQYHATISQATFWEKLQNFLIAEFPNPSDASAAWETFFCASKGSLTASEIAKIRDRVGVTGMAGT
ncbi:ubiquitin-domain-containing protein [Abortiporus biennis]|nr:ubiquitin-domain-containing protein [Abortiporus biennis]